MGQTISSWHSSTDGLSGILTSLLMRSFFGSHFNVFKFFRGSGDRGTNICWEHLRNTLFWFSFSISNTVSACADTLFFVLSNFTDIFKMFLRRSSQKIVGFIFSDQKLFNCFLFANEFICQQGRQHDLWRNYWGKKPNLSSFFSNLKSMICFHSVNCEWYGPSFNFLNLNFHSCNYKGKNCPIIIFDKSGFHVYTSQSIQLGISSLFPNLSLFSKISSLVFLDWEVSFQQIKVFHWFLIALIWLLLRGCCTRRAEAS